VFKCLACPPTGEAAADPLVRLVCDTLVGLERFGKPCSADDVAKGRFVEAAFPQNASYCAAGPALISRGLATTVTCCDRDLCNAPLDVTPLTNIVATTPLPPTLRCYHGVDDSIQLQTVKSSRCAA
jgi:hypothetical protein